MTRILIPRDRQQMLMATAASALTDAIAQVRADVGAPSAWRIDQSFASFYDPTGMPQAEIDAYDAAQLSAQSLNTSLRKEILAMLAVIVRQKNVSAWNAMTSQQKVTAVLAEAGLYKGFREFIDDKV